MNRDFSYWFEYGDTGIIVFGVVIAVLFVLSIILILVLSSSMGDAAKNNQRANQILASVPAERLQRVDTLYSNAKKNLGIALLLCLLLGSLGAHKVYLGKRSAAVLFLLFSFTGIPAIIALFNAANMPRTISEYNLSILTSLERQLSA